MASRAPNLQRLDSETRSKIRSTQILTSLPQIVSELVQNSLDAGAKNVEIGLDMDEWACWVRDDGAGMSKHDLHLIAQGCEHGRYATSKAYNASSLDYVTTFGFRGEALASASDLSCLEIASRTVRSKESWSVILRGGVTLYQGPSTRWRRERSGTTVAIRDAFYNLPIRRLSHPTVSRTAELIRREVETIALVFPNVAFSLEDSGRNRKGGVEKSRILSIPKTNTTLKAFRHIYGRTLVEHVEEMDEQRDSLKIEGFLSLIGSPSKAYQFLFVNRHILETCDLHRIIEKRFGASSFSKNALDEAGEVALPRTSTRRSPRKNERKPVYVLNLTVPPCQIDNCLEPAKNAVHFQDHRPVIAFLADIIDRFLVRHGFKTENLGSGKPEGHVTKRRRIESRFEDNNDCSAEEALESASPSKKTRELDIYIQNSNSNAKEEDTTWVDPRSGRVYIVDQRTGNSYLKGHRLGTCIQKTTRRIITDKARNHHASNEDSGVTHDMPVWIRKALEGNSAFAPTERGISDLLLNCPVDEDNSNHWQKQRIPTSAALQASLFSDHTKPFSSFTAASISNAHVIEQVDRKFIACLVELPTSSKLGSTEIENRGITSAKTLVLVDQHAADERIRVERYLRTLCLGFLDRDGAGVERRVLNPPVSVLLSKAECDALKSSSRMKKTFHNWGFDLCENQGYSDPDNAYATIYFNAVPEVVADKLLSGEDLPEFVKGFLARLASDGLDDSGTVQDNYFADIGTETSADESNIAWLKALRFCPRELVELINSKACRGAIMFNDALTVEQCTRLMRQLSTTAFPFQCAHGRPSVVPLMTIHPAGANDGMTRAVDWSRLNDEQ